MSRDETLEAAFRFLRHFKEGRLEAGRFLSDAECLAIKRLQSDLLPDGVELDESGLLEALAVEDTKWNQSTQHVISEIYSALARGDKAKASALQSEFSRRCPSAWYRAIVESIV